MRILILAAAVALALPAAAQTPVAPSPSVRAMAAGYKALMVCSAIKTAEAAGGSRTLESVEANELVGVYPELDVLVREMPVHIGDRQVSVPWDEAMPPASRSIRPVRAAPSSRSAGAARARAGHGRRYGPTRPSRWRSRRAMWPC